MNKLAGVFLFLVTFLVASGCNQRKPGYDFAEIVQGDTLRVITLNSSTSYFIYRDQPMGYHYDMIRDFCLHHGLVPHVEVAPNVSAMIQMLHNGEGDVIAYDLPVTNALKDSILYSGLKQVDHQVLVQRVKQTDSMVTDVTQLIGKQVTVLAGSHYHERIINLDKELGGGIIIEVVSNDTTAVEDLIRRVSSGTIEYTMCDNYLAYLNQTYFRNLDVHLQLSFDQRSSWAVRMDTPQLADSLDSWFQETSFEPVFLGLMKRYFEETKGYEHADWTPLSSLLAPGVISPYDIYFKQFGEQFRIDWRLLASVSYQESHFNPEGRSWVGATGLMGLMPATASSLGLAEDELTDPEGNIRVGTEYLRKLINIFGSIESSEERLKMALAAYNGGIGHVFDARALTSKYGGDDSLWEGHVEKYIQLKHLEQYYTDPVSKNGYFRGDETVSYVRDVINRWNLYKEKVKE